MPTIRLVAFRGTGGVYNHEHPHFNEPALVRAGHVALADVVEGKFIGFSPTPAAAQAAGSEDALLLMLAKREAQPGCLQDDTAVFERAADLADAGERTTVWQLEIDVDDETLSEIRTWYNEKREALYNFPDEDGMFEDNEYNCAVFPSRFKISLPVMSGSVKLYIRAMRLQGATKWQKSKP
jgi:hypothetical protein